MVVREHNISGLRKLLASGVSLAALFNEGQGGRGPAGSDRLNSARANSEQAATGQAGVFVLRPYTLEEKLYSLKKMVLKGKISLGARVTFDMLKHELKKPENDGLGVREMVEHLKEKKLLQAYKPPQALFRPKSLTPAF